MNLSKAGYLALAFACATTFSLASHAEVAGSRTARPLITQKIDETKLVTLEGNTPREAMIAKYDRGAVAEDFRFEMQMQLKRSPEQEKALGSLMDQLHTRGSLNFHKWLSEKEFDESFGVNKADVQKVSDWLESHGFTVHGTSADGMVISFSGTHSMVREAFHTELHNLVNAAGEKHFGNISDPKIPAALASVVVGAPLNNFMPKPLLKKAVKLSAPEKAETDAQHKAEAAAAGPHGKATYAGDCGFVDYVKNQTTYDSNCYSPVPGDLAVIYNTKPLYTAATPITGAGQTIGLIEDGNDYTDADYARFVAVFFPAGSTNYGASSSHLSTVHPTGSATCTNPGDIVDTDEEVELDIEYATATAPGANVVIESCADSGTTFGGLLAVQNLASQATITTPILSESYGYSEAENLATRNAQFVYAYQHAVARGISIFVSSGDESSASSDANAAYAKHGITTSGFATTPYNVAVGGTDFGDLYAGTEANYWNTTNTANYTSVKSYVPEIPWNDSCANSFISGYLGYTQNGTGSFCNSTNTYVADFRTTGSGSGGPSNCYTGTPSTTGVANGTCAGQPKPSWQSVFGNPSDSVRDIPDVSLFAANGVWNHYITVCYSNTADATNTGGTSCASTPDTWTGIGGTSGSSPMMAGIMALVNQYTGELQGNPNYVLYKLGANEYGASGNTTCNSANGSASSCVFNDVTTSDIVVDCRKDGTVYFNCYNSGGTYGSTSVSNTTFTPAYASASGWDFATGLGSVNAYNLVTKWQTSSSGFPFASTTTITGTVANYTYGAAQTADTLTGTVTGPDSYPTGSVTFNGTPTIGAIGTQTLAASAGCATGGTCTESATQSYTPGQFLTPGTYTVSDTYSSVNENYASSTSTSNITFTVAKATATAAVNNDTAIYNTATTLTATDTGVTGGAAPTGAATFTIDGAAVAGTVTCTTSGIVESCSVSYTVAVTPGSHTIGVSFAADSIYLVATNTGTLTVSPYTTTTTVSANPSSISSTGSTILTATVVDNSNPSATPTGTIAFTEGSTNLGSCTLSGGSCSSASVSASTLGAGMDSVTATYTPGSSTFAGSFGTTTVTVSAAPTIIFSSVSHNFGSVQAGTSTSGSENYGVQLTNNGSTAISGTVVINGAGFTQNNNCGTSIAAGAHCEIIFTFSPTAAQGYSATWYVTGQPMNATFSPSNGGTLTGTGVTTGGVTLTTSKHNFGNQTVGTTSAVFGAVLTNSTSSAVTIAVAAPSGNTSSFITYLNNCGSSLAAGASCNLQYEFHPAATGGLSETIGITANGGSTTITAGGAATTGLTLVGNGQ